MLATPSTTGAAILTSPVDVPDATPVVRHRHTEACFWDVTECRWSCGATCDREHLEIR
jgi:hypothetical protein